MKSLVQAIGWDVRRFWAIGLLLASCGAVFSQSFAFRLGVLYPAQSGSMAAAQGDFNGDGKPDIAIGNAASNSVSLYLGNGDGTFTAATGSPLTLPGGCLVAFLAAGDFNRDGKTDLLAVCDFGSTVWVLPGRGNAQFGAPISTSLPQIAFFGLSEGNFQNVAVGDFNNDGIPDLVIGSTDSALDASSFAINLMLAKGDGTFLPPTVIVSGSVFVTTNVVVGDFNRDGNLDLAVSGLDPTNSASELSIYSGNGKGTFQNPSTLQIPVQTALGTCLVADLNHDGIPDLVIAGTPVDSSVEVSAVYVYTGKGDGTFKQVFTSQEQNNSLVLGILAVDLRGSGSPDLIEVAGDYAAGLSTLGLWVRAGNGDGTFQNPTRMAFPNGVIPWAYGMLAGDWNGDGVTDLAFAGVGSSAAFFNHSGGSALQKIIAGYQGLPPGDLVVILNNLPPSAPVISVSSKQLNFTSVAGGVNPPSQSITLSNSGAGVLNWTATASAGWLTVTPKSGSGSNALTIAASAAGLTAGTYNGAISIAVTGASNNPQSVSVTFTVTTPSNLPSISGVVNGASFQPGIESGSWVTVQGSNLSNTKPGRTWAGSEIVNGNLPTSLDGTSVTIDGKSAFVYYISPTQLNVQAPTDSATGSVAVVVTNNGQVSAAFNAQLQIQAPAFFLYTGTSYAIASHFPDYALVGNPSAIAGTIAAHPGDVLILWATGFGPTNPTTPAGIEVVSPSGAATQPTITIGGVPVPVLSAVISPGSAGLYQVAIQLPATTPAGASVLQASVGGVPSPQGVLVFVAGQ